MRLFSTRTPKINHRNAFPTCFISFHWKCEHFSFIPSFCFVLSSDIRVCFFFFFSFLLAHSLLFSLRKQIWNEKKNCRCARSCSLLRFMVAKLFPSFWIRKTFLVVFILFEWYVYVGVCVCVWWQWSKMCKGVCCCCLLADMCALGQKKLEMNILWIVLVGQRFYDAKSVMIVVFFLILTYAIYERYDLWRPVRFIHF